MDQNRRSLLRAAILIHEQLALRRANLCDVYLPERTWVYSSDRLRQSQSARDHGWYRAASRLQEELLGAVQHCRDRLTHVATVLNRQAAWQPLPRQRELYQELLDLQLEFGQGSGLLDSGELLVTTGPIVLEGVQLGRFEIRLNLDRLPDTDAVGCYRVVAVEPYRTHHDVIHVQKEERR